MPKRPSPCSARPSSAVSSVASGGFLLQAAGQPEVEDLDESLLGDHHVLGLEVAVDDASGVGGGHPRGGLEGDREDRLDRRPVLARELAERSPRDIFHRDDWHARRVVHGVDRAQVGMVQRGGRAGLGQGGARRHRAVGLEDFQGDGPVELEVPGPVDPGKRPGTHLGLDQVMREIIARPKGREWVECLVIGHPVFAAESARLEGRQDPQHFLAPYDRRSGCARPGTGPGHRGR